MDLLAANDQENRVRSFAGGAAGKALGNSLKPQSFAAKTPGNRVPKTPFKVPLNDENDLGKTGKGGLKTNGKGKQTTLDKNAFITPAGKGANWYSVHEDSFTDMTSQALVHAPPWA